MISVVEATSPLFTKARRALFNIAPERADSLAHEVFGSGKWRIDTTHRKANFAAVVDDKEILCSFSGLASLWCLSYAAFHIMDIGSKALRDPTNRGVTDLDIGPKFAALNLEAYIEFAETLFNVNALNWQEGLALPNADADLASSEGRINNVFFGALSWVLLHEVGHVHHGHVEAVPSGQKLFLEHQADDFATGWILESAGEGLQNEFRVLMISVALCWLFLGERQLGQGTTHPAAILRFQAAVRQFKVSDRSVGLENAAYVLKGILDPRTVPPPVDSAKEMFDWTAQRLEVLFPVRGHMS